MEIKHVAAYYFLRTIMNHVDLRGLSAKVHETWHYVYSNHLNYNILPRSGVIAESLRAGSENMRNFVTFWPTLLFKDDQKKIQVVTSSMTLKVHHV